MLEISYLQMLLCITAVWVLIRLIAAVRSRHFSLKREFMLLLVYVCIIVIARLVYFGLHHVNGRIDTLKIGPSAISADKISLIPFYFLFDRYGGWLLNIIGNIAMFIPVGIVWPACFRKLDSIPKVVLAGAGFSLLIEVTQLVCLDRHSDVDDLLLNTCGAALGACIYFGVRRLCRKKQSEKKP